MSIHRPAIAVIIPAYNLAAYLPEAIESALRQTLPPDRLDIVVVDDGSTDETADVAARYAPRVRYVHQENRGLPATRNRGIAETTAPLLAFLDADDRLLPEKLATELALLEADPATGLVYSGWRYIDEAGVTLPQRGWSRDEGDVLARLLLGNLIHPHAPLVRRSLVEAAGAFDETLTSVEDWDLWLRLSIAGARWRTTNRPLLEYRVRRDGMHANPGRMLQNRLRVLDKVFGLIENRPDLCALRPRAYQQAHLEAACDWARQDDLVEAAAAMRAAVRESSAFLCDPRSLREVARLLLPLGQRNDDRVTGCWEEIGPRLRLLVRAATPMLGRRARLHAEAARLRLDLRHRRKRLLGRRGSRAA